VDWVLPVDWLLEVSVVEPEPPEPVVLLPVLPGSITPASAVAWSEAVTLLGSDPVEPVLVLVEPELAPVPVLVLPTVESSPRPLTSGLLGLSMGVLL
jgi:hypothetical protein